MVPNPTHQRVTAAASQLTELLEICMPTTKVGPHTLYFDEHGKAPPVLHIAGLGEAYFKR